MNAEHNFAVDDFFSFVIKMPTLHRLACFRDDVVFVSKSTSSPSTPAVTDGRTVLLYQMYIYPKDMKRANEWVPSLIHLCSDV